MISTSWWLASLNASMITAVSFDLMFYEHDQRVLAIVHNAPITECPKRKKYGKLKKCENFFHNNL